MHKTQLLSTTANLRGTVPGSSERAPGGTAETRRRARDGSKTLAPSPRSFESAGLLRAPTRQGVGCVRADGSPRGLRKHRPRAAFSAPALSPSEVNACYRSAPGNKPRIKNAAFLLGRSHDPASFPGPRRDLDQSVDHRVNLSSPPVRAAAHRRAEQGQNDHAEAEAEPHDSVVKRLKLHVSRTGVIANAASRRIFSSAIALGRGKNP
jgi:hypothetical protein